MSKKTVEVKFNFDWNAVAKSLKADSAMKKELAEDIRYTIESMIKPTIQKGISPVKGERTFAPYKDPKKYPGDKKASNRPNLTLSGEMLKHYEAKEDRSDFAVTIGIHSDAPDDIRVRADANQFGTESETSKQARASRLQIRKDFKGKSKSERFLAKKEQDRLKGLRKGIAARPFVPQRNQTFNSNITVAIRDAFATILSKALKRLKG